MAQIYALLKPDGDLLIAHPRGGDWRVSQDRRGIDARGRNLTVFLNGLDVLGLSVSIPARNDKEARRAAPFAIEDDLAETVEDSHVALAEFDKDNAAKPREINVVSNAAMTALIQSLSEQGFDEADLVAAHSLLPPGNTLYEAPGLVLGRLDGRGFALDPSLGRDVLIGITEAHPEIEIYGAQVARAMGRPAQGAGAGSLEALLIQLASWAEAGRPHISLRQGAFEARRQVDMAGFGRWKFAGALAAVAALGWFGSVILETNAMNDRAQGLENLAEEFARVGWPELNGDVQQALAAARNASGDGSQGFLGLLDVTAVLYDALDQVEGSELRSLRYDRVRRQMTASVAFQSFADVDRLTAILNGGGLTARSGDARQSGSRVIGDLTLEPGA
ncbi:MAG: type II secretion system protein GspL [Pseudomonadota bacterium]